MPDGIQPTTQAVPRYMRAWLRANERGRLTFDQWLELTTRPLLPLVLLAVPVLVMFAFNPVGMLRVVGLARYGTLLIVLVVAGIAAAIGLRGVRYTRLPVQGQHLYGGEQPNLAERLMRRQTLYTPKGAPVALHGRIGSAPRLLPDERYIVYYIEDREQRVLVSYAPAADAGTYDER